MPKSEIPERGEKSEMPERGEKDKVGNTVEPHRRMMPGMKAAMVSTERRTSAGVDRMDGEGESEEEEEEKPTLPTPRKRLLNFKIPLLGGQRRDQQKQQSVVARRRLFKGDRGDRGRKLYPHNKLPFLFISFSDEADESVKTHSVRQGRGYYSDISSSEDFSSEEEDDEEEGEGLVSSGEDSEGGFSSEADKSRYDYVIIIVDGPTGKAN